MGNTGVTPVAVIGMACRLPGGIDSPDQLWAALLRGDDLVTEIPPDRWDADDYYDPEPGVPGRSVSRWGGFLDDVGGFDAEFFGITEREAMATDPQHRLLLETSWEAMEHAGLTPQTIAGSLTGVFVGLTHGDYQLLAADARSVEGPYGFTGTTFSLASGRIAYALGVHGPAFTVDSACSSGLLAVHLACRSLHGGECDLAFAGGACVVLDPRKFVSGSAQGMLSPTGRCRAFDAAADGFVTSEGCAVVLLKRLPDALADGDRVLAVVRGTAANQDGRTVNIATPSLTAQTEVYRAALAAAGVDAGSVGMVEAHGAGTPVGDPIEYASLARLYGVTGPCALTSVKTNFGHTQSASGALSLMKTVLALRHGVIPPHLHFTRLPDELAQIETKLFVPQATTPWPGDGRHPRRAVVSSYGLSGTNVHAVLEQAPPTAAGPDAPPGGAAGPLLFPLSATSAGELRRTSRRLAEWVPKHAGENPNAPVLSDLAYTLARRRVHRSVRTAVVAADLSELTAGLREIAEGDTPYPPAVGHDADPVWVFSGQGSQWAAMGAELLATEPAFAAAIAELEPLIAREAGFSVSEALAAPQTLTGIDRVQPALFAMQVALAATMTSYGVRPGAVIGHSMGEVAAAVVAGALSPHDGVRVSCRRSRLMSRLSGAGAMASVELPAQQVLAELTPRGVNDVVLSVVASPRSTVVGGAAHAVRDLVAAWERRGLLAREVAVDVASHSPQVDPILGELADALAELTPMTPQIRFYSATLFDPREQPVCDAGYWVDNLRHTVRFAAAVQAALQDGHRVFAELAPHPLLIHAVEETARSLEVPVAALACMRRDQALPHGLLGFLADLHSAGAAVDFSALYPHGRLLDAPLPTWTHRQFLLARDGREAGGASAVAGHPLLGPHVRLMEEPERHAWHAELGTDAQPWLGDHRVHQVAALPGAAYCEMALAAAQTVLGDGSEVRDLRFEQLLLLDDRSAVGSVASVTAPGAATFAVETNRHGERVRLASAVLCAPDGEDRRPGYDPAALLAAHPRRVTGSELRRSLDTRGIHLGPAFSGLTAVHTAAGVNPTVVAEVTLPSPIRPEGGRFGVHPALLDACFQSVAAHPAVQDADHGGLLLPVSVRRLRAYGPARSARYCYARVTAADTAGIEADLDVLDEQGTALLIVRGLRIGTGAAAGAERDHVCGERLLTVEWRRCELPEVDHPNPGTWLLISTSTAADVMATRLTDALKLSGAHCTTMCWPQQADHEATALTLGSHLGSGGFSGVVVLTGPRTGDPDDRCGLRALEHVHHLVRVARGLAEFPGESPRLYVVTGAAQAVLPGDEVNLEHAGLRGLIRVIGAEHPQLRATVIDVDERTDAERVARQLMAGSEEDETAWRHGEWFTARLCSSPLRPDERRTTIADHERDGMRLQIRTPGDLQTLELVAADRVPPGPGQIEVAVNASSVNFADVLVAFGRYPGFEGWSPQLGADFAGVVTAVGPDVTDHRVGDHVAGISPNGCWGTFVTCDARLAVTLPPGVTDYQAAAVATAHATAWHGLHNLAGVTAGERVLIHSATGGVGQAAIAIARRAGAEIFATAGSPERRELLRSRGIEHVYDSRSTEFAELIRRDTDGYGVDIVLNSLPGAAQRAGLELLAFGGRFVEIGKRDIYGDTRLGLFPFRRNLTFHAVDLGLLAATHPGRVRDVLQTVLRLIADGALPAPEYTRYPLADAATAIRVMSAARHTGKLVLDIAHRGRSRAVVPPERAPVVRRDGAYIITGGLGGLGLFLAGKMAEAGAGRIVLGSRSRPDAKARQALERIRATGADVVVECGDIAEPQTAHRLVSVASVTGLPVRGVLHAAAVVEDATLPNITAELLERDWAPKVYGAWNLHRATATLQLDWFCSFSSAAALVGSPGQGAYAAANSWLDAFTHWRRAKGLPATAIAWGAWADIGRATAFAAGFDTAIDPEEGARAFRVLLSHDRAYSGYAPVIGAPWLTAFAQRSPFAEAFRPTAQSRSAVATFRAELTALPPDERSTRVRRLVSEQVSLILRRTVDPDRPLSEYGLDSLGNLELRTRIETEAGVRINPTDITTVRGVAAQVCDALAGPEPGPASGSEP
ncbi:MAG: sulfolipid-1 biosynthesis phthioceranic/hydroxyphthioceranic acid synthase [Mycobacterium sp.]|uniref:sulfolipid-1 biosynthesis phthioceranic/hydroxyphthioceranic acid synthase n=1 Tax=Mycobacterium sp. TaxID=1785 RepID=UPI00263178C9|nr:sulfolipid-1 biosynthesis phthioceranic/hydroxyphthioceranic acid synthase [Mycobacterium sp.]MDI3314309.1 sulfolipid-1 biosynthesis phthioceranic/hydroxyphthioceranic acid synthase [Mycobacterium sp.]